MKTTINKLIDELNKAFAEYNSAYPMYEDNGKLVVDVEWGDWKHDHWLVDEVVEEKAEDLGLILFMANTILTAENGSDCFSATHIYRFIA